MPQFFAMPGARRALRPSPLPLVQVIRHMAAVARQRRALSCLSDAQLDDIGLTRAQAQAESRRAFWDLPRRGGR